MSKRAWTLGCCTVAVACLIACGGPPAPKGNQIPKECAGHRTKVTEVWNEDVSAQLKGKWLNTGQGIEGGGGWTRETYHQIDNAMDRVSEDWARMRTQVCMDQHYDRITKRRYQQRVQCLDNWLKQLRTAVSFGTGRGGDARQARRMFMDVESSGCGAGGPPVSGGDTRPPATEGSAQPPRRAGGTSEPASGAATSGGVSDGSTSKDRVRGLYLTDDSPEHAKVKSDVDLKVSVVGVDGGDERPLPPGAELQHRDTFYMNVDPEEPLYVYIAYVDPAGEAHLLFPQDGRAHRVPADEVARVPPRRAIGLDCKQTGTEQMYVIASSRPIDRLDDDTAAAIEAVREGRELPDTGGGSGTAEPADRSQGRSGGARRPEGRSALAGMQPRMRTRGLQLVNRDHAVWATTDDAGVAVVYFPIAHVAGPCPAGPR